MGLVFSFAAVSLENILQSVPLNSPSLSARFPIWQYPSKYHPQVWAGAQVLIPGYNPLPTFPVIPIVVPDCTMFYVLSFRSLPLISLCITVSLNVHPVVLVPPVRIYVARTFTDLYSFLCTYNGLPVIVLVSRATIRTLIHLSCRRYSPQFFCLS